ncbi:integrin alpha-X-like isoform X1 [Arapaima gigas]
MDRRKVEILLSFATFLLNLHQTLCFSVDTENPRVFRGETDSHFGHRTCHFDGAANDTMLVTAPLHGNRMGGVYQCSYRSGQCNILPLEGSPGIALGLSLSCDAHRAVVCGPHVSHDCQSFRYLNGLCMELGPQLTVQQTRRPAFQECLDFGLDAVILFDDSQSISKSNFRTMISFIKSIVGMFTDPRSQVAVAQYSTNAHAVFHFENFAVDRNPESLLGRVQQSQGQTYTPSAIRFVLEKMLVKERGMRPNSKKLLVVITDGRSNDPKEMFTVVIPLAEQMGVIRYAIGVGKQYSRQELEVIASSPNDVFETDSFDALSSIQKQLGEKIFAIEGTAKSNFSAFQLELSQGGFSTALSQDTILFGAVGAYEWSGGIVAMTPGANGSFINTSAQEINMKDSYLGYSVAVAQVDGTTMYFAGAPRYLHTGLVLGFQWQSWNHTWAISHRIHGTQLGSYFGAELCVLGVSANGTARQLLLIGVPQYRSQGVGGEVRICPLEARDINVTCSLFLHGSPGTEMGQFGASMSPVPDLNGDGFSELAVGAPLEEGGRGSVYLFLGRSGGLQSHYSQRVLGAIVDQRLQYFGVSVHSAGDLSSDGLPDLVIGSKGAAVVLRSQPVMCVSVSVVLDPPVIPRAFFHCAASHGFYIPVSTTTVCVTVMGIQTGSIKTPLQAKVSVSMELDAETQPARLLLSSSSWNNTASGRVCHNVSITVPACVSDYRPVPLTGHLLVQGMEVEGTNGLKATMSPDCSTSFSHLVMLEQVCGEDQVCICDLQVSLNISRLVVVSSPGFSVNLLVRLFNYGEDALGVEMHLFLPSSLSFIRATKSSGTVGLRCVSSERDLNNLTQTVCQLSSNMLTANTSAPMLIHLSVSDPSSLAAGMKVKVSVSSKNENNDTLHDNSVSCPLSIRTPINVIVKDGGSTAYITYPDHKLLEHIYRVENIGESPMLLNLCFIVPVDLGAGLKWNTSLPETDRNGTTCFCSNITAEVKQPCTAASCQLVNCTVALLTNIQPVTFKFSGAIIGGSKVVGRQMNVSSWGSLSFNKEQYTQFPTDSFHSLTITTVLEEAPAAPIALIAVGIVAALVVLAIVSGVLYKRGFFKPEFPNDQNGGETTLPHDDGDAIIEDVPSSKT